MTKSANGSHRPARSKNYELVQLAAEGIKCDLRVRSLDRRARSATYEIVIANKSEIKVSCRLYGMDDNARTREFGMLTVGKHSAGSSFFSVPLEIGDRRRIYVEVVGEGLNLFAEALQPTTRLNAKWPILAFTGVVLSTAAAVGSAYLFEKPSIEVLDVPASSSPGTVIATYAIGGKATAMYRAQTSDGHELGRGTLARSKGKLAILVPASAAGHVVRVFVEARGPLGYAGRATAFNVVRNARVIALGSAEAASPASTRIAAPVLSNHIATSSPRPAAVKMVLPSVARPAESLGPPAEPFSVSGHLVAGQTFNVFIARPATGLHLALKDNMQAIVDDISVPAHAGTVTFSAPASTVTETYYLVGTSARGQSDETTVKPLQIYPR